MRIAFIGQRGIPATIGEIEKHVEKLSLGLIEMGHEVFVYAYGDYTDKNLKEYKGIKIVHSSGPFSATFHSLRQKYDVIHYQDILPALLSFIPKILNRKTAIISTIHFKNNSGKGLKKKIKNWAEKITCYFSVKTIVTSKNLRSYIFSKYAIKSAYIHCGAEVKNNSSAKVLDRWNLKKKRYIFSFGNVLKNSEMRHLVESFRNINNTNKIPNNFKLIIAGSGSGAKAEENIIFTESQNRATLEQLFSHAYIFVQPSESKGNSMPILEAMGHGIAPLVSDISENLEIIGKCGFSFHSKRNEDLEEKLAYLLNKPGEVGRMGKLAKERVLREYSWDSIARKTLRIYELALESKGRGKLNILRKKVETYV
jgi:glycosyltransferase involved in cell wall biosynthesis